MGSGGRLGIGGNEQRHKNTHMCTLLASSNLPQTWQTSCPMPLAHVNGLLSLSHETAAPGLVTSEPSPRAPSWHTLRPCWPTRKKAPSHTRAWTSDKVKFNIYKRRIDRCCVCPGMNSGVHNKHCMVDLNAWLFLLVLSLTAAHHTCLSHFRHLRDYATTPRCYNGLDTKIATIKSHTLPLAHEWAVKPRAFANRLLDSDLINEHT